MKTLRPTARASLGALLTAAVLGSVSCKSDENPNPNPDTGTGETASVEVQSERAAALWFAGNSGLGGIVGGGGASLAGSIGGFQKTSGKSPITSLLFASKDLDEEAGEYEEETNCQGGGTITQLCEAEDQMSRLSVTADGCNLAGANDQGIAMLLDGAVFLEVNDPLACLYEDFDLASSFDLRIEEASFEYNAPNDQSLRVDVDATISLDTRPVDTCLEQEVEVTVDGVLAIRSSADDSHNRLTAEGLRFGMNAIEDSETCGVEFRLDGRWTSEDLRRERSLEAEYDDYRMSFQIENGRVAQTINGSIKHSCVGTVNFTTIEPVVIGGSGCPVGGTLEIELSNGNKTRMNFLENGKVELDFGADGSVDRILDSCHELDWDVGCTE